MEIDINKDLTEILLSHSLPSSYEKFRCAIKTRDEFPDSDTLKKRSSKKVSRDSRVEAQKKSRCLCLVTEWKLDES